MTYNPNININFVKDNLDKYLWNWCTLSKNPNISWRDIEDNPHLPWNFIFFCLNPNISMEIILKNRDNLWDYTGLLNNPGLYSEYHDIMEIFAKNIYEKHNLPSIQPDNNLLMDETVNKREKTRDIKKRYSWISNIFNDFSFFSRNIDKIIRKRLNYT
jgi:hypothetical protein